MLQTLSNRPCLPSARIVAAVVVPTEGAVPSITGLVALLSWMLVTEPPKTGAVMRLLPVHLITELRVRCVRLLALTLRGLTLYVGRRGRAAGRLSWSWTRTASNLGSLAVATSCIVIAALLRNGLLIVLTGIARLRAAAKWVRHPAKAAGSMLLLAFRGLSGAGASITPK